MEAELIPSDQSQKPSSEIRHDLLQFAEHVDKKRLRFENLPKHCQSIFEASTNAAHNPTTLSLFLRLLKYFDGGHHLEEMMYRENLLRGNILNILDQFKPLLLTAVREDEIAS
uniref:GATOR1 complex protein NPRL3 C-terminal HTH domain-containing protein n=1 Tax=Ciona savignyi TaxID=51511 RepID=H2Z1J2_CIOSA